MGTYDFLNLQYGICFYFIACESAKREGFLFESHTITDYLEVEVEGLNEPLDALTSCTWVKFRDSSFSSEFVFCTLGWQFCLGRQSNKLVMKTKGGFR